MKIKAGDTITYRRLKARKNEGYGPEKTGEVIYVNKHYITLMLEAGYKDTIAITDVKAKIVKITNHKGGVEVAKIEGLDPKQEQEIREKLDKLGMKKRLSPAMIVKISKEKLEKYTSNSAYTCKIIADKLGVSATTISFLKIYYDLHTPKSEKKEVDTVDKLINKVEPVEVKQEEPTEYKVASDTPQAIAPEMIETPEQNIFPKKRACILCNRQIWTGGAYINSFDGYTCKSCSPRPIEPVFGELKEIELPLFHIIEKAEIAATIIDSLNYYLNKLDDQQVEVTVTVKKL